MIKEFLKNIIFVSIGNLIYLFFSINYWFKKKIRYLF